MSRTLRYRPLGYSAKSLELVTTSQSTLRITQVGRSALPSLSNRVIREIRSPSTGSPRCICSTDGAVYWTAPTELANQVRVVWSSESPSSLNFLLLKVSCAASHRHFDCSDQEWKFSLLPGSRQENEHTSPCSNATTVLHGSLGDLPSNQPRRAVREDPASLIPPIAIPIDSDAGLERKFTGHAPLYLEGNKGDENKPEVGICCMSLIPDVVTCNNRVSSNIRSTFRSTPVREEESGAGFRRLKEPIRLSGQRACSPV